MPITFKHNANTLLHKSLFFVLAFLFTFLPLSANAAPLNQASLFESAGTYYCSSDWSGITFPSGDGSDPLYVSTWPYTTQLKTMDLDTCKYNTGSLGLTSSFMSGLGDGDYAVIAPYTDGVGTFSWTSPQVVAYFTKASGVITIDNPAPLDGINTNPTPADTSSSAYNVLFEGTYTNGSTAEYDKIVFAISDITDSVSISRSFSLIPAAVSGAPYSYTIPLTPRHSYEYTVRLHNSVSNTYTDATSVVAFSTTALAVTTPAWEPETCDSIITDFGGCVRNFMHEAFYPSAESMAQFSNLTLANSAPFSYLYDMGNLYNELFSNSGGAEFDVSADTPIGEIVFINRSMVEAVPLAGTIKTALGYILWFMTGLLLYRMLLGVHKK